MKNIFLSFLVVGFLAGCRMVTIPMVNFPTSPSEEFKKADTEVSFALVQPVIRLRGQVYKEYYDATAFRFVKNLESLKVSIMDELEKDIVKKGIRITDKFSSINDMTYSQKKETSGVIEPYVLINLDETGVATFAAVGNALNINSTLKANVKIALRVIEPLSREKIWIKNTPSITKNIRLRYNMPGKIRYATTPNMLYSSLISSAKQLDKLTLEIYKRIVKSANKYIDLHEFKALNTDIKRLKGSKRY